MQLNECAMADILPDMQRIVIGVDPSGASGDDDKASAIGIVAAGLGIRPMPERAARSLF